MMTNKEIVLDFLHMVVRGEIDQAYEKYVDMSGKHHNVFTPAGFEALRQGMKDNEQQFPDKPFVIKRVIADGDMVATHSSIDLKAPGPGLISVVHWFRLKDGKIVEMWDVGQPVPQSPVNADGAF